ncbi:MAG TPA: hypothetical protein VEK56_02430 [Vicinamibacterales bacterium]|nr:hypothetical protein [Vicinamibacterales bacterium]
MSAKRYQFKVIETETSAELETRLQEAGAQQWCAVGYGVTPEGRRTVLMQRKVKMHGHHQHRTGRHGTPPVAG